MGVAILLALNMGAKGFLLPVIQGGAPEFEQVNGARMIYISDEPSYR